MPKEKDRVEEHYWRRHPLWTTGFHICSHAHTYTAVCIHHTHIHKNLCCESLRFICEILINCNLKFEKNGNKFSQFGIYFSGDADTVEVKSTNKLIWNRYGECIFLPPPTSNVTSVRPHLFYTFKLWCDIFRTTETGACLLCHNTVRARAIS